MTETCRSVVAGVRLDRPELNGPVPDWAADEATALCLPLRVVHAKEWPRGTSAEAGPEHPAGAWSKHFRANGRALLDESRTAAEARLPALSMTRAAWWSAPGASAGSGGCCWVRPVVGWCTTPTVR